jgi:hypothetical protein
MQKTYVCRPPGQDALQMLPVIGQAVTVKSGF